MKPIRWGILGTAKIAVEKVVPALQASTYGQVLGMASRRPDRLAEIVRRLEIPRTYPSYDALLEDPHIDAVYIPLPNHLHVPWSIRALEHGKHVLCEKPIGCSVAEAESLQHAARRFPKLKLMEGFMYRHHPQWQKAAELVRTGQLGDLTAIQTFFSFYNDDPHNIRHRPEWGGGALMDIGCYPISLSRWLFDEEPVRVRGHLRIDPRFQVDRTVSGILEFSGGRCSTFIASMESTPYQRVQIVGDDGRVEIEIPFNAPPDRPCRLWFEPGGKTCQEFRFPVCDQYTIQGDLFALAVLEDRPVPTPIDDAVANMRVIEALVETTR